MASVVRALVLGSPEGRSTELVGGDVDLVVGGGLVRLEPVGTLDDLVDRTWHRRLRAVTAVLRVGVSGVPKQPSFRKEGPLTF